MGFLSDLLSVFHAPKPATHSNVADRKPAAPKPPQRAGIEVRDRMVSVWKPTFYGVAHRSRNGRWLVGLRDSDGISRGGCRETGNGLVMLMDRSEDTVVHQVSFIARPSDAAVSDDGAYVVVDTGFGLTLSGDLIAINPAGEETYRKAYAANVFNIAISKCGSYGAVQTANAPGDDGNILEVLDLSEGRSVFRRAPTIDWADGYEFEVGPNGLEKLWVQSKELGRFAHSSDGTFLDAQEYENARLTKGHYGTKVYAAQELLKDNPTPVIATRALIAIEAALGEGADTDSNWNALAYRAQGEALELLERGAEALACYEKALALNAKIGIKKRASVLQKKLAP